MIIHCSASKRGILAAESSYVPLFKNSGHEASEGGTANLSAFIRTFVSLIIEHLFYKINGKNEQMF